MTELARRFPQPDALQERMLKQAARELLLAQASDWPFILRMGTSSEYARKRVKEHLLRFTRIYEQLTAAQLDQEWLKQVEWRDNIFPDVDYHYWT
jgi:1,4-alpha-glucan branching enzyme